MFALTTLIDVFARIVSADNERAVLWQNDAAEWVPLSGRELASRVYALANAFQQWGIRKGDRIAILAENRWEWPVTDFATLVLGAADVPIYPTLTAEQTASLLADSSARIAVVSTRQQYDKVASIRSKTSLERIVVMDELPADAAPGAVSFAALVADATVKAAGVDLGQWLRSFQVAPGDLATLIYTSGTTGEPKGVMLTHGNIASNLNYSTENFPWNNQYTCISFLPLSHVTARHLDYALFCYGSTLAYCPHFDRLPSALLAVKPTVFVAVPRVYEKIRQEVERRARMKPMTRRIFSWAMATGRKHREAVLRGETPQSIGWRVAEGLVFSKVRAAFGGQVRDFIAGGAPLGMDTAGWFADAGIRIFEGYGLTETSPVIALNNPAHHRIGSVGQPIQNVQCRLAPDAELLVRGPSVFGGYWKKPEATAEAIDAEGWFSTGDIARLDEDGYLFVTDRKKELLKTSGGKLIAPQPIENRLKANVLVANAALVGDKRKHAAALIAPNFPALEGWARQQGIAFRSRAELIAHPAVRSEYSSIVHQVNATLANFETIKRFELIAEEWTVDSGELTPSMKLKRRVLVERYADRIDRLYADELVAKD